MKQLNLNYKDREYQVIMCLDGHGLCDVTVYRKRLNKKWYQFKWENFTEFVCCPETIAALHQTIRYQIKKKVLEEEQLNTLREEYRKLEDVPFL